MEHLFRFLECYVHGLVFILNFNGPDQSTYKKIQKIRL